jgi:hypothetical protein
MRYWLIQSKGDKQNVKGFQTEDYRAYRGPDVYDDEAGECTVVDIDSLGDLGYLISRVGAVIINPESWHDTYPIIEVYNGYRE